MHCIQFPKLTMLVLLVASSILLERFVSWNLYSGNILKNNSYRYFSVYIVYICLYFHSHPLLYLTSSFTLILNLWCSWNFLVSCSFILFYFILLVQCCDHPYLIDNSLASSLTKDLSLVEKSNFEVNASGKLWLLDKILQNIKTGGLRVLILFQVWFF